MTVARSHICTPPSYDAPASSYAWYGGENSTTEEYVAVGGVFAVRVAGRGRHRCSRVYREAGVQNIEAFLWAVRTFKTRYPSASANFTIRAVAFDSCADKNLMLQQVLNLEYCQLAFGTPPVSPKRLLAFVGTDTGEQAAALATELTRISRTLVSPAASNAFLSDVTKYPYFLRTVPSDGEQAKALVAMLAFRRWRYVQLVLEEGDGVGEEFRSAATDAGICIVQTQVIPKVHTSQHLADIVEKMITKKETRVVVVLAGENTINELLLKAISTRGMFTWVGGNSWGNSKRAVEGAKKVAEGAVIVALRSDNIPNSAKFMDYFKALKVNTTDYNPWMTGFWEKRFNCTLRGKKGFTPCRTELQSLDGVQLDTFVPYTIEAVDAILHGFVRASKKACPSNDLLCSTFIKDRYKWAAIHNETRSGNFNVTTGETLDTRHVIYNFIASDDNCADYCYKEVRSLQSFYRCYVLERLYEAMCVFMCTSNIRRPVRPSVRPSILSSIHPFVCVCVCVCVRARACMPACVRACVRACPDTPCTCIPQVGSYTQPSADKKTGGIYFPKDIYMYDKDGKHTPKVVVTICGSTPCRECGGVDAASSSTTPQSAGQVYHICDIQ